MTRALLLLAAIPLAACGGAGTLDYCKHAELRRAGYTAAITAADVWDASGRVVPYQIAIGRQAAVTALGLLNARCPAA